MTQSDIMKRYIHQRRTDGYRMILTPEERRDTLMKIKRSRAYLQKYVSAAPEKKEVALEFLADMEKSMIAALSA